MPFHHLGKFLGLCHLIGRHLGRRRRFCYPARVTIREISLRDLQGICNEMRARHLFEFWVRRPVLLHSTAEYFDPEISSMTFEDLCLRLPEVECELARRGLDGCAFETSAIGEIPTAKLRRIHTELLASGQAYHQVDLHLVLTVQDVESELVGRERNRCSLAANAGLVPQVMLIIDKEARREQLARESNAAYLHRRRLQMLELVSWAGHRPADILAQLDASTDGLFGPVLTPHEEFLRVDASILRGEGQFYGRPSPRLNSHRSWHDRRDRGRARFSARARPI